MEIDCPTCGKIDVLLIEYVDIYPLYSCVSCGAEWLEGLED
jgi:DNA-directed RNA polymerase subunit RPC12/RpoP